MSNSAFPAAIAPVVFETDCQPALPASWVWQGILSRGHITLLTSQWKSGKSTLLSLLLGHRSLGALAGFAVTPGKSLVYSEEDPQLWSARHHKLPLSSGTCLFCRPFLDQPRSIVWPTLLEHAAAMHQQHGFDLLAIDTLAYFLPPFAEGNASLLLDAFRPLQQLAARNLAVVLSHHPAKGETTLGQAARGTGALAGVVDTLVEMDFFHRGDLDDRRRRFHVLSRLADGPRQFVLALNAAGDDYHNLGSPLALDFASAWSTVTGLLSQSPRPLSRRDLLDLWPDPELAPNQATLWRFLQQAVQQGLVHQAGKGTKCDPFRYRLA